MSAKRLDEQNRDHVNRIASLLILGAALIGLGELIRRGDDNLHDLGD